MFVDSKLVESDDIDRLYIVLEFFNFLLHEIRRNLLIFYSCTDDNLVNAISDWLLLPLSLPEETIHLDSKDLLSKGFKISILTPWLDFPDD